MSYRTMRYLALLIGLCALPVPAHAQNNRDGLFGVAERSPAGGAATVSVRRSERPSTGVTVGPRITRPRVTIRSIDNQNRRFSMLVRSPRVPTCGAAVLRIGEEALLSESYGHDAAHCSQSFLLTPSQASRAARLFGTTRVTRTPLGTQLRGRFTVSQARVASGAGVEVIVTIANPAGAARVFRFAGGRNRGPRNNRFSFTIERDGQPIAAIEAPDFGGLGGFVAVEPGSSAALRADVSQWGDISTPGRYVVRCAYETELSATGDLSGEGPVWDRRFEGEVRFQVR